MEVSTRNVFHSVRAVFSRVRQTRYLFLTAVHRWHRTAAPTDGMKARHSLYCHEDSFSIRRRETTKIQGEWL